MELLALLLLLPLLFFGDLFSPADAPDGATDGDDTLTGTAGNDVIDARLGSDRIDGLGGDDLLLGNNGSDTVHGGAGNDEVRGGDGADYVYGGAGDDIVRGGDGADWIFGSDGADSLYGGIGSDVALGGEGNDNIFLNEGDDAAWYFDPDGQFDALQAGNDTIHGGTGSDSVKDHLGANTVLGEGGNDTIDLTDGAAEVAHTPDSADGGFGNDTITGDSGDTLTGGGGIDSYLVTASQRHTDPAVLTDFNGTEDLLTVHYMTDTVTEATPASLTVTTDPDTGNVMLSWGAIDLAILTAPTGFNPADVVFTLMPAPAP